MNGPEIALPTVISMAPHPWPGDLQPGPLDAHSGQGAADLHGHEVIGYGAQQLQMFLGPTWAVVALVEEL